MKKLVSILIFLFLLMPVNIAFADTKTPHIIIEGDVFLQDLGGKNLFILPNTYYAKINNIDEEYYYIIFNGVSGKVSKKLVSTTGYSNPSPSTTTSLAISEDYKDFGSIHLKSAPDTHSEQVIDIPVSSAFTFIGEYPTVNGNWYYVKFEQFYGYIKSDRTTIPEMNIDAFAPSIDNSSPSETEKPTITDFFKDGSELKLIIIIGVMVPSVLMILLLFKPNSKKYKRERID